MESSSYDNTSQPTSSTPLSKALYEELGAAVRGGVYPRSDVKYVHLNLVHNMLRFDRTLPVLRIIQNCLMATLKRWLKSSSALLMLKT